jgi:hypothetical protein
MSRILSSVFGGKLGLGEVDEMLPRATLSANEIDRQNHIMFLRTIDKTHPNAGTFRLVLQAENFSRLNHPPDVVLSRERRINHVANDYPKRYSALW